MTRFTMIAAILFCIAVATATANLRKDVQFTVLDADMTNPAEFYMELENPVPQEYCTSPRYPIVPGFGPIATDILFDVFPNGTVPKAKAKPTNTWQKNLWGFEFDNFDYWNGVYPYPYIVSPKKGTVLMMYPGSPVNFTDNGAMQQGFHKPSPAAMPPIHNASYPYLTMSAGYDLVLNVFNAPNNRLAELSLMGAVVDYLSTDNATVARTIIHKGSPFVNYECNNAQLGFGSPRAPPIIDINGKPPGTAITDTHFKFTVATGPFHPQGQYWHAFFDSPVTMTVPENGLPVNLSAPFTGVMQVGCGEVNDKMASLLEMAAGVYVRNATVSYDIDDAKNELSMTFKFNKKGNSTKPLTMLALAHHARLMSNKVHSKKTPFWTVKGNMTAVQADQWVLKYNLTSVGFGDTAKLNEKMKAEVKSAAINDYKLRVDHCPGDNATWGYPGYMNMELYAYVRDLSQYTDIAIVLENVGERTMAVNMTRKVLQCMQPLLKKPAKAPHACPLPINNTAVCVRDQMDLYFDQTWGGIITGWFDRFATGYCQCDKGSPTACLDLNYCNNLRGWNAFGNYGNAFYNDHHFQYGYVIKNLAWPVYFQQEKGAKLGLTTGEIKNITKKALAFARDIANPDADKDQYFAYLRHKDTFDGHSWAEGYDYSGRMLTWVNQQSGGEAINAYYGIYLLGVATNDSNVRDWGRVNMATEMVSLAQYQHLSNQTEDKIDQPTKKVNEWGKCLSILIGSGGSGATYFGPNSIFECGITILPISPVTREWLGAVWAKEAYEWLQAHVVEGGTCVFFNPLNMTTNPCPGQMGPNWMGNEWACCPTNAGYPENQWRAYPEWFPFMYLIQSVYDPAGAFENFKIINETMPTKALPFPYLNNKGDVVGFPADLTRTAALFNIANKP